MDGRKYLEVDGGAHRLRQLRLGQVPVDELRAAALLGLRVEGVHHAERLRVAEEGPAREGERRAEKVSEKGREGQRRCEIAISHLRVAEDEPVVVMERHLLALHHRAVDEGHARA